jgi:Ca2+-binding RTX toxin-like protein
MNITGGVGDNTFVYQRSGPNSDRITDFGSIYFHADLDGSQEFPTPTGSPATGTADFVLNKAQDRLTVSAEFDLIDLDGNQTPGDEDDDMGGLHIHRAPAGANGGVVWGLVGPANDTSPNDLVIDPAAGTVTGAWDEGEGNAGSTLGTELAFLLADGLYLNLHTHAFPGGEIRGQILRQDDGNDVIDLTQANIGGFATLQAILGETAAGDAFIRSFLNGQASTLVLAGVSIADLDASDFLFAGAANETVNGTAARDDLFGAGGRDRLMGRDGNDRLFGEDGNDTLVGGAGNDTHNGGDGRDLAFFDASGAAVVANLGLGRATGQGIDRFFGVEDVRATNADDRVTGDGLANAIHGLGGNDTLFGGAGNDTIRSGTGDDRVNPGTGSDVLFSEGGRDVFLFDTDHGFARVMDFNAVNDDKISFKDNANFSSFADVQAAMTQVGGDVRIRADASNHVRLIDVDIADVTANDFIF